VDSMSDLLETSSISWTQTVRIALLGEGLHPVVRDEWALTGPNSGSPVQVVAVPDAELSKARAVLGTITPPKTVRTTVKQKLGLAVVGLGFVLGFAVLMRFSDFGSAPLADGLLGAATVLIGLGAVSVFRTAPVTKEEERSTGGAA